MHRAHVAKFRATHASGTSFALSSTMAANKRRDKSTTVANHPETLNPRKNNVPGPESSKLPQTGMDPRTGHDKDGNAAQRARQKR